MKRLVLLLPLFALAAAPAWAEDPATNAPTDPSTFTIRVHRAGRVVRCVDSPNWSNDELSLLREWTASFGKGGSVSFITFVPALVVSSDTFNANFLSDGTLVLNARSANGSNWIQRVRAQTPLDAAINLLAREKAAMSQALTLEVKEKAEAILRAADSEDGVEYFLTNEQESKLEEILGSPAIVSGHGIAFQDWLFSDYTGLRLSAGYHHARRTIWDKQDGLVKMVPGKQDIEPPLMLVERFRTGRGSIQSRRFLNDHQISVPSPAEEKHKEGAEDESHAVNAEPAAPALHAESAEGVKELAP